MKKILLVSWIFVFTLTAQTIFAQNNRKGPKPWPDKLKIVELEGVVTGTETLENTTRYYFDVNADGEDDYILFFGPTWYTPPSEATLPEIGDNISIIGHQVSNQDIPHIIVFEINGLVWRLAVEHRREDDEWPNSFTTITVSGNVIIDDTYYYEHYYLDIDGDGEVDYRLSFGPSYYEPESGATRPQEGDEVTITGGLAENADPPRLIVYEIDGLYWRDPYGPPPWAGRWVKQNKQGNTRVYCPTDSLSWLDIPAGAMQGQGQGNRGFSDSIFCQLREIFPDSMPGQHQYLEAAFQIRMFDDKGKGLNGRGKGQMVRFMKAVLLNLHWPVDSTGLAKLSSSDLILKYWDEDDHEWIMVENVETSGDGKTVLTNLESFTQDYGIFSNASPTEVSSDLSTKPQDIYLTQNHPNPFNPTTEITYSINSEYPENISLTIYSVRGEVVRNLISGYQSAGVYHAQWDGLDENGKSMPSGIYIYQLKVGQQILNKRMTLLK